MQPSLEAKKKFLAWFLNHYSLKKREAVWILNYLLNHEVLLKNIHFVSEVQHAPRGLYFSVTEEATDCFFFYKHGVRVNNPEQAFHELRMNWREDCYIEMVFEESYSVMLGFGVVEMNPYVEWESHEAAVEEGLVYMQQLMLKDQLLIEIDKALEQGNQQRFLELTTQLKELEVKG